MFSCTLSLVFCILDSFEDLHTISSSYLERGYKLMFKMGICLDCKFHRELKSDLSSQLQKDFCYTT